MEYFKITDDIEYPNRWYLGDINVSDMWQFSIGKPVDEKKLKNLKVKFDEKGESMDFTLNDGEGVPIISQLFAECLREFMDDIQLLPLKVPGISEKYYIMVIKNAIECVDENLSVFEKFEVGNDIRPDLAGDYQDIEVLKVDTSRINRHIFRIAKYEVAAIVSGEVKDRLGVAKVTGIEFELVS